MPLVSPLACDDRSRSEFVVPLRTGDGEIAGVMDVDSDRAEAFSEVDRQGLERIVGLIYT